MGGKRLPDSEYNPMWLARITARCTRLPTGCLVWEGQLTYNGYAQSNYRGKNRSLHRAMYEVVNGVKLPSTIDVCHRCDVRNCIEPSHLWAGTRKENMRDCSAKGRADRQWMTHCEKGHEFTPVNTYITRVGWRQCKTCRRIRLRIAAGWPREEAEAAPEAIPQGTYTKRRDYRQLRRKAA